MSNNKIREALMNDPATGRDLHSKAGSLLVGKLLQIRSQFPFIAKFEQTIRKAIDDTAVYFQNNDVPEETQKLWLKMIEDFIQAVNSLGMIGVSYAVSRKEDSNINELKQKALAKFNASAPVPTIDKEIQQLKQAGVDTSGYEAALEQEAQNVMQNIFSLEPDQLTKLTSLLNISPEMKTQITKIIDTNRKTLSTNKTAMTVPQKGQTAMSPEIAQQLSDGFKQYMNSLKTKYGPQSIQILNQEIQNFLQNK